MMMLKKKNVLTPFTKEQAVVNSYGYFSNTASKFAKENLPLEQLNKVGNNEDYPFEVIGNNIYRYQFQYFYPVPYKEGQRQWVEDNNIKPGDKVKITRDWGDEGDFNHPRFYPVAGKEVVVKTIYEDAILGHIPIEIKEGLEGASPVFFPYWAAKKLGR